MLFRNKTHQEVWIDRWCRTCFQPDEAQRRLQGKPTMCPILNKAMVSIAQGRPRKPEEWERTRADEMEKSIKCNAYQPIPPPVGKRDAPVEDVPMFDVEIPVDIDTNHA